jgi:cationic peptide transport system permease protein
VIRYSLRRLLLFIITLWLLSVLMFALNYWFPGDTLTNMSGIYQEDTQVYDSVYEVRGFDNSLLMQYVNYTQHLLSGDWGRSQVTHAPVFESVLPRLGATLELGVFAMLLAVLFGLPLGVYAAVQQNGKLDRTIMGFSLSAYSVPVFWLAQLFILFFAVKLDWSPISGQINPLYNIEMKFGSIIVDILSSDSPFKSAAIRDAIYHLWLPVLVLAIMPMTMLIRSVRNSMLSVMQENYITAARARGLHESRILFRHIIPNAMQPIVRQLGLQFNVLMTNIIIVEVIFNWPGMGSWLVKSIYERDYPVIQGGILVLATLILLVNAVLELIHAWRFPQVRKEHHAEY